MPATETYNQWLDRLRAEVIRLIKRDHLSDSTTEDEVKAFLKQYDTKGWNEQNEWLRKLVFAAMNNINRDVH